MLKPDPPPQKKGYKQLVVTFKKNQGKDSFEIYWMHFFASRWCCCIFLSSGGTYSKFTSGVEGSISPASLFLRCTPQGDMANLLATYLIYLTFWGVEYLDLVKDTVKPKV